MEGEDSENSTCHFNRGPMLLLIDILRNLMVQ